MGRFRNWLGGSWPTGLPVAESVSWKVRNLAYKLDKRRPASLREFDLSRVEMLDSPQQALSWVLGESDSRVAEALCADWPEIEPTICQNPERLARSGIGSSGQLVVYGLTRLLRPRLVLETGTHDGVSAATFAAALISNGDGGRVVTLDIRTDVGRQIPDYALSAITPLTAGSNRARALFRETLRSAKYDIFLHDSDHSYENTRYEIGLAVSSGIPLVIVDDADYNLAFLEWAARSPWRFCALVTPKKIIGIGASSELALSWPA